MSNLFGIYNKILGLLHILEREDNYRRQIRKPKFSDKQFIALSLTAETRDIDSERYLFKQLPPELRDQIEPAWTVR